MNRITSKNNMDLGDFTNLLTFIHDLKFLVYCALTFLLCWAAYAFCRHLMSPLRKIPSPPGLPFVGQMFTFLRSKDVIELLTEWAQKYGPIYTYRSRPMAPRRVLICDPDLVKQVTVTDCQKYERTDLIKLIFPNIGNSLFGSKGKDHARQRKMLGPAFHYSNLKGMVSVFEEDVLNLIKIWTAAVDGSEKEFAEIKAQEDLNHLALDVIGKCAFGYRFDTLLSGESNVSKTFSDLLEGADFKYLNRKAVIPFYKYLPLADNKRFNNAMKLTNNTVLNMISERRKQGQQGYLAEKKDLLELLMDIYDEETGYKLDDEELRSQVFTFLLAGHETTSVSLSWTLHELSRHPEQQEKIREEVNAIVKDGEDLTWEKLERMKYVGSVIKESLRLHTPAMIVYRISQTSVCLGGFDIPAGTLIGLGLGVMQRLPKYWPDPLKFNPDRFLEGSEGKTPIKAFLPFSSGPRHCIGEKFAMAEMKVVISRLLQRFSFAPMPGYEPKSKILITAKPSPPLALRVTKYTGHSSS